jgi:site-specific DNA-methyltransferase (adenine-specific)
MGFDMLELQNGYMLNGDCLELMKAIPDKSVDMILCDLPYGTTACKWDTIIPFEPIWKQYKRLIKDNGAIVLTASQPFTSALVMSNPGMFKYCWVWDKKKGGSPLLSKIQPIRITEDVVVFGKGRVTYNPIMTPRDNPVSRGKNKGVASETTNNAFIEDKIYTEFYPKNILEISNADQTNKIHPTQKPVALFEYLIKTYTNEEELVLDNCSGSGTTAISCINTNRNYICIEKDNDYFNKSVERINNHVRIKNIRIITELPL